MNQGLASPPSGNNNSNIVSQDPSIMEALRNSFSEIPDPSESLVNFDWDVGCDDDNEEGGNNHGQAANLEPLQATTNPLGMNFGQNNVNNSNNMMMSGNNGNSNNVPSMNIASMRNTGLPVLGNTLKNSSLPQPQQASNNHNQNMAEFARLMSSRSGSSQNQTPPTVIPNSAGNSQQQQQQRVVSMSSMSTSSSSSQQRKRTSFQQQQQDMTSTSSMLPNLVVPFPMPQNKRHNSGMMSVSSSSGDQAAEVSLSSSQRSASTASPSACSIGSSQPGTVSGSTQQKPVVFTNVLEGIQQRKAALLGPTSQSVDKGNDLTNDDSDPLAKLLRNNSEDVLSALSTSLDTSGRSNSNNKANNGSGAANSAWPSAGSKNISIGGGVLPQANPMMAAMNNRNSSVGSNSGMMMNRNTSVGSAHSMTMPMNATGVVNQQQMSMSGPLPGMMGQTKLSMMQSAGNLSTNSNNIINNRMMNNPMNANNLNNFNMPSFPKNGNNQMAMMMQQQQQARNFGS